MSEKTKILIKWEEINYIVNEIERQIRRDEITFDMVYGIPRGGLILAIMLSHRLKIPLCVSGYTEESLVCDDISDTGVTLKNIKAKKIACMYSSLWTETLPDYCARLKTCKDTWLIYPWENLEAENGNQS
jgi:hypoxanthine phosphoribosyltransferase